MITKEEYYTAIKLVKDYKDQENNKVYLGKSILNKKEYRMLIPVIFNYDLRVGHILFLQSAYVDDLYIKVKCTGGCGDDEFWGKDDTGKEQYWTDRSRFCIVDTSEEVQYDENGIIN